MIITAITDDPIDVGLYVQKISHPSCGAVITFEGVTRSPSVGGVVDALDYEVHRTLAERQLRAIAQEAMSTWSIWGVVAVHRSGLVPVGEPGVIVVVAAAHRDAAFDACRQVIDRIKDEAAIWKKELFVDGTSRWVGIDAC